MSEGMNGRINKRMHRGMIDGMKEEYTKEQVEKNCCRKNKRRYERIKGCSFKFHVTLTL